MFFCFSSCNNEEVLHDLEQASIIEEVVEEETIVEETPEPEPEPTPEPEPEPEVENQILKAFPAAYGGGAYATGGRGGTVYHVTNLKDDGSTGSLSWAIRQPRPAIIVFDVSGTINLTSIMVIQGQDLTIAGQTAPAGGITITSNDDNVKFRLWDVNNIIIRYIRFRWQRDNNNIGIDIYGNNKGAYNLIFDHVSLSYAGWTGVGLRGVDSHNNTFQNSIIAESKTGAIWGDSDTPGYSYDNSFNNNFFYNVSHRFPNSNSSGRVDVINNVIQNYYYRQISTDWGIKLNHINNYTAAGPHKSLRFSEMNRVESSKANEIYSFGNIIDNGIFEDPNGDNRLLWSEYAAGSETKYSQSSEFIGAQHALIGEPFTIKTAAQAYADIITNPTVGCSKYLNADGSVSNNYDANDTAYLAKIAEGEGAYEAYTTGNAGTDRSWFYEKRYLNFLASISSTPQNTRPSNYDTDRDGMPDVWEVAKGFNPNANDSKGDADGDGYTNLEEFLNRVDYN
tara:strand:- start:1273 stop:2796 length:1524 start_codon:yes stop_codon:yes gene_type:complete